MSSVSLKYEDKLLLMACATAAPRRHENLTTDIPLQPVDWDYLVDAARKNRLLIPLRDFLSGRQGVPSKVNYTLTVHSLQIRASVARTKRNFEQALPTILKYNDIILLRGIAYAYTLYADRAKRVVGDVDLLIDRPKFLSISGMFLDHHHIPKEVAANWHGPPLEYHHNFNNHSSFGRKAASFNMGELWARARRVCIGNSAVGVLAPEDNFLYLCHHNVAKGFVGLYRFVDMIEFIHMSKLDWDLILDRAKRYKVTRAVWMNCRFLNTLCPGIVEGKVVATLAPTDLTRRLVGALFDVRMVIHDPNPLLRSSQGSALRNVKKNYLAVLLVIRWNNAYRMVINKVLIRPFIRLDDALQSVSCVAGIMAMLRSRIQKEPLPSRFSKTNINP